MIGGGRFVDHQELSVGQWVMKDEIERNLGEQPLARLMESNDLRGRDLVEASMDRITFKMVSRACKGRRLTPNVKAKILDALNASTGNKYAMGQLFNY